LKARVGNLASPSAARNESRHEVSGAKLPETLRLFETLFLDGIASEAADLSCFRSLRLIRLSKEKYVRGVKDAASNSRSGQS